MMDAFTAYIASIIFSVCVGAFFCINMDKMNKRLDVIEKVLQIQNNEKVK